MIFSEQILFSLGAEVLQYEVNELIFSDGQRPNYYYQVSMGAVKLTKDRENGTETILSIFLSGECFAETFLFDNKAYPFNAVAMELYKIFRVPGERFVYFAKNTQESLLKLYCYNADKLSFY
ncbi:Crp/Fnr family transcriptional regulator [Chryseobacterium sp. SIMBA_029]|uniref:Crp/Fnr family transcriptional regulator n=1 Tax=Chryseobacterium sp. SIMBA_029 TaxID=3085772 RepID=UPI00397D55F0